MGEILQFLVLGFKQALIPYNIMWVFIGGLLGTIIGMLPGLGPATGVAILIPIIYGMDPTTALVTMCAIYYGAMFGGSRSSILINTPGDGSAIAATFDGYPMTQKGKAGSALAMSAIASFIGGILSVVLLTFLAQPVSKLAIKFGPPQYFALMIFALSATISISQGALFKGCLAMIIGLMLSTIGIDLQTGVSRFTMGIESLYEGIDFLIIIIGIYAVGEVFKNYGNLSKNNKDSMNKVEIGKVWITKKEWKRCLAPILRSTPLGFLVGVLPGAGGSIASMMAYTNEKQLSKNPEEFGKGEIVGLAAPEAANNAASVGALIPMLTMGIPGSGTTAVMLGALMMLGIQPGPLLFTNHPDVAWGVIASMYVGNILLAIINIPLAAQLVKVLRVPKKILMPIILVLAFIGAYTMNYSVLDFYLLVLFGLVGFYMKKLEVPIAPLVLAIILGEKMEQSFRQALSISQGNYGIFVGDFISVFLLLLAVGSVAYALYSDKKSKKKNAVA